LMLIEFIQWLFNSALGAMFHTLYYSYIVM